MRTLAALFVIIALSISFAPAAAQTSAVTVTLLREPDMLTVYVQSDQRASLLDFRFQYLDDYEREILLALRDYDAFREAAADVRGGCFVLRTVNTDVPIPQECAALGHSKVFVQEVGEAGLFWFDTTFNLARPLVILDANGSVGVCPADNPRCELAFPYAPFGEPPPPPPLFDAADIENHEILVLITDFEQISGSPLQPHLEWERVLDSAIAESGVNARAERVPQIIRSHEEARTLSEQYGATLVIWGYVGGAVVNSQYTITPRWSQIRELPGETEVIGSLDDLNMFVSPGGDVEYVLAYVMAQLAYFANDDAGALPLIENALALAPAGREVEMGVGALYFFRGHVRLILGAPPEETFSDLNQAVAMGYQHPKVYQSRAWAYEALGDLDLALADVDTAISLAPSDPVSYAIRGSLLVRASEYAEALEAFDTAITLDPTQWVYYIMRGALISATGDYDAALADFNQAVTLAPDQALPYTSRGTLLAALGDFGDALDDLNQAIALDAAQSEAYSTRALITAMQGEYESAIEDLDVAIQLNPDDAAYYQSRALIYAYMGETDLAIRDYDQAIALNPSDADAYANRGDAYLAIGNYARALADYDQALLLNPDQLFALEARANLHTDLGDYRAAVADFEHITEIDPENIQAYAQLARINTAVHRCQAAVDALRRYLELAGSSAEPEIEDAYRQECGGL